MPRCTITTVTSLRKILADLPDDHLIGTNRVGNLSVYKPDDSDPTVFVMTGYIKLMNEEFFDGTNCEDAEYTPDEDEANEDPAP
jgi:hypothetical protein